MGARNDGRSNHLCLETLPFGAVAVPKNNGSCVRIIHLKSTLSHVEQRAFEPLTSIWIAVSALLQHAAGRSVEAHTQLLQAHHLLHSIGVLWGTAHSSPCKVSLQQH
jgi:hypothetical protein